MKIKSTRKHTPRTFDVTITEGEADFLVSLLATVSGDSAKSPRKYANRILDALVKVTGEPETMDAYALIEDGRDEVHFRNYDEGPDAVDERLLDIFRMLDQMASPSIQQPGIITWGPFGM